ncbi:MAG: hypothetical protein RIS47_35 [Bacteroidota bacterium]|jgi:ribonuclease-3
MRSEVNMGSGINQRDLQNDRSNTTSFSLWTFFRSLRHNPQDVTLLKNLKGILGFKPGKLDLYKTALIHRSASISDRSGRIINNERLEFLGDAVLDAIVADYLFHKFPNESEGFLTQMRSRIVNGEKLSDIAMQVGLHRLIFSNTSRPQAKKNLFGDAFEAIIGAIFLDKGYSFTAKFIVHKVLRKHIDLTDIIANDTNYKSQLIEWAQREKKEVSFETHEKEEDYKNFLSIVIVNNEKMGHGEGSSKKIAEQEAAKATLEFLAEL